MEHLQLVLRILRNSKSGECHAAKMSEIVGSCVQPCMLKLELDTDGETQEEVATFRMQLDISEWLLDTFM